MLQTEDDVICIINEGQEGRFLNFHKLKASLTKKLVWIMVKIQQKVVKILSAALTEPSLRYTQYGPITNGGVTTCPASAVHYRTILRVCATSISVMVSVT